jgi:hypothetical protein
MEDLDGESEALGNPIDDSPMEDAPLEDTPLEDAPLEDTPLEDAPLEDTPLEDAPTALAPEAGGSERLDWDALHHFNAQRTYCYCGEDRTYAEPAAQCNECSQWFHARCIEASSAASLVPMQRNYEFTCRACGQGNERFEFTMSYWRVISETTILNLALNQQGTGFRTEEDGARTVRVSLSDEIIPWATKHFATLGHGRELAKMVAQAALDKCVFNSINGRSFEFEERTHVALRNPYDIPLGSFRPRKAAAGPPAPKSPAARSGKAQDGDEPTAGERKRQSGGPTGATKKPKRQSDPRGRKPDARRPSRPPPAESTLAPQLVPENCRMVPLVRSTEYAGVSQDPSVVQLSVTHKAANLRVSLAPSATEYMCATGYKGYRTVCATHCVGTGCWYYEVSVDHDGLPSGADATGGDEPEGHCRLGWATELAPPDAPAGYDEHSYCYRSKHGTVFHQSRGRRYGQGYGAGDVIGCLIHLPQPSTLPRWASRLQGTTHPRQSAGRVHPTLVRARATLAAWPRRGIRRAVPRPVPVPCSHLTSPRLSATRVPLRVHPLAAARAPQAAPAADAQECAVPHHRPGAEAHAQRGLERLLLQERRAAGHGLHRRRGRVVVPGDLAVRAGLSVCKFWAALRLCTALAALAARARARALLLLCGASGWCGVWRSAQDGGALGPRIRLRSHARLLRVRSPRASLLPRRASRSRVHSRRSRCQTASARTSPCATPRWTQTRSRRRRARSRRAVSCRRFLCHSDCEVILRPFGPIRGPVHGETVRLDRRGLIPTVLSANFASRGREAISFC